MFLRKVYDLKYCNSLLSQQQVVRAVDIMCVYDACHGTSYPIVCLFKNVEAYPVICMQVGIRSYGHPNFAMEKPMYLNSIMKSLLASF